jgi:hypothetical protein
VDGDGPTRPSARPAARLGEASWLYAIACVGSHARASRNPAFRGGRRTRRSAPAVFGALLCPARSRREKPVRGHAEGRKHGTCFVIMACHKREPRPPFAVKATQPLETATNRADFIEWKLIIQSGGIFLSVLFAVSVSSGDYYIYMQSRCKPDSEQDGARFASIFQNSHALLPFLPIAGKNEPEKSLGHHQKLSRKRQREGGKENEVQPGEACEGGRRGRFASRRDEGVLKFQSACGGGLRRRHAGDACPWRPPAILNDRTDVAQERVFDRFGERTRLACCVRRPAEHGSTEGFGRDAQAGTRDACAPRTRRSA